MLQGILDETSVHLQKTVTNAPNKQTSLVVARLTCEETLKEVDAFLDKCQCPSPGFKLDKYFLRRIKFIAKDTDGLKVRLKSSGDLLHACLTSLTSLSVIDVQDKLEVILMEIKQGKHEKSVLSMTLVDCQDMGKNEVEEALEQLEDDLIDKDIHPDAIDLHRKAIKQWLLDTIMEEAETKVESKSPEILDAAVEHIRHDPAAGRNVEDLEKAGYVLSDDPSEEDLYESSVVPQRARNISAFLDQDTRGRLSNLPPPSEAPSSRSRRSTLGSHASQDSLWHPSAEADPAYVSRMLAMPFQVPALRHTFDVDKANFYFKRAFRQQDHREQGYLTRHEVVTLCRDVTIDTDGNKSLSENSVLGLIHMGDQNQDGQVDIDEFVVIMHNVLESFLFIRDEKVQSSLEEVVVQADAAAKDRQATNILACLPWGFARDKGPPFLDIIEDVEVDRAPPLLPLYSFTLMAREIASFGVGVLSVADERWRRALPDAETRQSFRNALFSVRDVSIRFTMFFDKRSEESLSDLDEMIAVISVVQTVQRPLGEKMNELQNVRKQCAELAANIRGFVWRLQHPKPTDDINSQSSWPATTTLSTDLKNWELAHMETWAWVIGEKSREANWEHIREVVDGCRKWYEQQSPPTAASSRQIPHSSSSPSGSAQVQSTSSSSPGSSRHIYTQSVNTLYNQAVLIAKDFCYALRQSDADELNRLHQVRRNCVLEDLRISLGQKKKLNFSKGKDAIFRTLIGVTKTYMSSQLPNSNSESCLPEKTRYPCSDPWH